MRPSGDGRVRTGLEQQILDRFAERLRAAGSLLLDDDEVGPGLRRQVGEVVQDVLDAAAVGEPSEAGDPLPPGDPWIGATPTRARVHPSESLWAAGVLFDVALPVLARDPGARAGLGEAQLAQLLHRTVMRRVVPAAVGYIDVLLAEIHRCNSEERHRFARELHDRIAGGLGVGLQSLELFELYAGSEPDLAAQRLRQARSAVEAALHDVRELAADLRETVGARRLDTALRDYLTMVGPPLHTQLSTTGDPGRIPVHVKEESFLIAREAIRNAVLHARGASRIEVLIGVAARLLEVTVRDDGAGFEPSGVDGDGLGLASMRERADLLGAGVEVRSRRGIGTTVLLRVPLPFGTLG